MRAGRSWNGASFELASVDVRREILGGSARAAADAYDPDLPAEHIGLSEGVSAPPTDDLDHAGHLRGSGTANSSAAVLDASFDRQIEILRQDRAGWEDLRRWAAHRPPADAVADAFLRTALGDNGGPGTHPQRMWAEDFTAHYTTALARTRNPDLARQFVRMHEITLGAHATSLDRSVLSQFQNELPDNIESRLAGYHAGTEDPGSLSRSFVDGEGASDLTRPRRDAYGDVFPSHVPPPEGDVPTAGGGGTGGGGGGGGSFGGGGVDEEGGRIASAGETVAMRTAAAETTAVAEEAGGVLARSYGLIRFSGRVGGVVFGRLPEAGEKKLDIVGLTWASVPQGLLLKVVRGDGKTIPLGPFQPSIVHEALAFAADGRTVLTTMPIFQPAEGELVIKSRQVVIHPALEDTPLGCDATQIDRFVDTFTNDRDLTPDLNGKISVIREQVSALPMIIKYEATLHGVLEKSDDDISPKDNAELVAGVSAYWKACHGDANACFPMDHYKTLNFGFAKKILACSAKVSNAAAFDSCVADVDGASLSYWVDSGVREQPYRLDADLHFLTGPVSASQNPEWPVQFVIQAVPQSLKGSDDVATNFGGNPWEFPLIADDVAHVVRVGIAKTPSAQAILGNMRQFVVLQRFFRNALNGNLGSSFPLSVLPELARQTRASVRVERTEKWNANLGFLEVEPYVHKLLTDLSSNPQMQQSCRDKLRSISTATDPAAADMWQTFAQLEQYCPGSSLDDGNLGKALSLRDGLRHLRIIDEMIAMHRRPPENLICHAL